MIPGILGRAIARSCRNVLVMGFVVLLGVAGVGALMQETVKDYLRGPREMTANEVGKIVDLDKVERTYVEVHLSRDNFVKAGVLNTYNKETKYYFPVWVGTGYVLTDSATRDVDSTIVADLRPLGSYDYSHIVAMLPREVRGLVLPVTMYRSQVKGKVMSLAVVGGLIAVICLWKMLGAGMSLLSPGLHPAARALKRFGKVREVATALDAEMRKEDEDPWCVRVSQSWLMWRGVFGIKLIALADVAWVYKRVVRTYVNFVPVGRKVFVVVCDRFGVKHLIKLHEAEVEEVLVGVHRAVPWALIGYDRTLSRMWFWKKRNLLLLVGSRKKEFLERIKEGVKEKPAEIEMARLVIRRKPEGSAR